MKFLANENFPAAAVTAFELPGMTCCGFVKAWGDAGTIGRIASSSE